MSRPRVVLVGPMGAGKSTVGPLLAEGWGVGFRDTDADVEATAGTTVAELFVDSGEAHFRALEQQAVATALAEHDGVLALGGGAVMDPLTRERLAGHTVVFLRVGLSQASSRVGLNSSRPLLLGNVRSRLKTILDERATVYTEVSSVVVDTDDLEPAAVAEAVRAAVEDVRA